MMFKILFSLEKFNHFLSKCPGLEVKFHSRLSIGDPGGQRRPATGPGGIKRRPQIVEALRERVTWKKDANLNFDTKRHFGNDNIDEIVYHRDVEKFSDKEKSFNKRLLSLPGI